MYVNILTDNGILKVKAYKTEYKNIVVVKNVWYTITHYPTGLKINDEGYNTKKQAFDDLPRVVREYREEVNKALKYNKNKYRRINP